MTYGLFHYGLFHLWLREPEITRARAEDLLAIAEAREFRVWVAVGTCLKGAALASMGSPEEGLALMRRGLDIYQTLKTPPVFLTLLLLLQAEAFGLANRPGDGLIPLDEALRLAGREGPMSLSAEFCRIKGELLLAVSPDKPDEAEAWLEQALDISTQMQAPMLELRAAMSLARLRREQGKTEQARQPLRSAYEKMTEGFTTADLKQAKALLEELG